MKDQTPKRPNVTMAKYVGVVLIIMLVFNTILMPMIMKRQVRETSYSHFLDSLDKGIVKLVQLQPSEINYITEENEYQQIYRTGVIDDPTLVPALREKGVQFGAVIPEQPNPLLSFLCPACAHRCLH